MSTWSELAAQWASIDDPEDRVALFDAMHEAYEVEPHGSQTPGKLPYPFPSDPVAQGADAIRSLAQAIDPRIPVKMARGAYQFPTFASQASGNTVITFAAGAFTAIPMILTTTDNTRVVLAAYGATVNGFTFIAQNVSSSASTVTNGQWLAMQLPASLTALLADAEAGPFRDGLPQETEE